MKLGRVKLDDGLTWVVMTVGEENSHIVPNECGYICIPIEDIRKVRECDLMTLLGECYSAAELIHQLDKDYPEAN